VRHEEEWRDRVIIKFRSVPVISQDKVTKNVGPRSQAITTTTQYDMSSVYSHVLNFEAPFAPGKRFGMAVGTAFAVLAISFIIFGRSDVGMAGVLSHKAFWIVLGVATFLGFFAYDPSGSVLRERMSTLARKDRGLKENDGYFECVTEDQWSTFMVRLTGSTATNVSCLDGQSVTDAAVSQTGRKGDVVDEALAEMRQKKLMASPTDNTAVFNMSVSSYTSGPRDDSACEACGLAFGPLASLGNDIGGYLCRSCGVKVCDRCCYLKAKESNRATMLCPTCGSEQMQVFSGKAPSVSGGRQRDRTVAAPRECPSCGMPLAFRGVGGLQATCQRCGQRLG